MHVCYDDMPPMLPCHAAAAAMIRRHAALMLADALSLR